MTVGAGVPAHSASPRIVLILGDQLSPDIQALKAADRDRDVILMAEVHEEATYVPHHKKKVAFIFSAMRHFAKELESRGWRVDYTQFQDPCSSGTLCGEVQRAIKRHGAKGVIVTEPGEYRLKAEMGGWSECLGVAVDCVEDRRFVASHAFFQNWAQGRKQLRMEYFYREMRKKTGLLMQGDKPEGGKWNYDADNRKPARADLFMPRPYHVTPDEITCAVLDLVAAELPDNFGTLLPFLYAVTQEGARAALAHFVQHALPSFGDYQDAMLSRENKEIKKKKKKKKKR